MGNFKYKYRDRVCPGGWPILILTFTLIAGPSILVFIFTCYGIGGLYGTFFLGIPYLISLCNSLRVLINVTQTDPGIIPKLRSQNINYNRNYSVAYREANELNFDENKSAAANFFSLG